MRVCPDRTGFLKMTLTRAEREKFSGFSFSPARQSCQNFFCPKPAGGQLPPGLGKRGLRGSVLLLYKAKQWGELTANWPGASPGTPARLETYRNRRYQRGVRASYGRGGNTGFRDLASQTRAGQKARPGSWGEASLWCGQSHVPMAHPDRAFCHPLS